MIAILLLPVMTACNNHYTPKPSGFFRIDTGANEYRNYDESGRFGFLYSDKASIEPLKTEKKGEEWFNINYPEFNARIYCSYMDIKPGDFDKAAEDSRTFVYRHAIKADNIDMKLFSNEEENVYGTLYLIDGNVASPIQFTLSDSVSYFFRGALYFNESTDRDSIAPVLDFIDKDIHELISSFRKK